jgi:hypothetical protein
VRGITAGLLLTVVSSFGAAGCSLIVDFDRRLLVDSGVEGGDAAVDSDTDGGRDGGDESGGDGP